MNSIAEMVFEALDDWLEDNNGAITSFKHPNYTFRIGTDTVYAVFETVHEVEQWINRYYEPND